MGGLGSCASAKDCQQLGMIFQEPLEQALSLLAIQPTA